MVSYMKLDAVLHPIKDPAASGPDPEPSKRKPWRIEDSIFGARPRENDSAGYTDKNGVGRVLFEADWARCMLKEKFSKFLGRWTCECTPTLA